MGRSTYSLNGFCDPKQCKVDQVYQQFQK